MNWQPGRRRVSRCCTVNGARGLGLAYVHGFKRALGLGANVIVQMDQDFSDSPGDVPKLVDGLKTADVVIGSRIRARRQALIIAGALAAAP